MALSKRTIQKFNKLYETILSMKLHIEELTAKETIMEAAIKNPKKISAKRKPGRPRKAK